jgi:two-component system NtrC family sensor kinase
MSSPATYQSDWRLRVFDSLSFPTRILTPDGTIIAVNRRFLDRHGELEEEVVGATCREINQLHFPHQSFPCTKGEECPLCRVVTHKDGQTVLLHATEDDGEQHWEERVFSPILDDRGEVDFIIESIRDVTNVKRLEKMYSDMRQLIDNVVQSSVSGIIAADRNGDIILANEAAEELFGYSSTEIRKVNIEDFYPPGVARDIMSMLRDEKLGRRGKLPITQLEIISKHGEKIPVEMTAAIIYEGGEEVATAGIFNDLREKLAVERKLRESQMKIGQTEKMASLGRLAAGVAHEINNPLTSILMYGSIIREKLERDHPLSNNLDYVLEDANRCKDIVKNLLAYSRQSSPSREVFPLNMLVSESLRLLHDQRLFQNVRIVPDLIDHEVLIRADKNQICQVVINLIMNSVDAMEEQGTLTLATSITKDRKTAILSVTDTGSGIPEGDVLKIFDPFFTTKEPGKGTGLGLSMAYGVLEENQGRIYVRETSEQGTTICLELPVVTLSNEILFDSIG